MKQPELGAYITTLRNKKGLTQKELAEQCNVDIRTIQRIENGDVVPRMYTVNLLSKALDAEIKVSASTDAEIVFDEKHVQQMRFAWIWGIVFSVNYIEVIYSLMTGAFNAYSKLGIVINIICAVLFFRGFYHLGKKYNNQVLVVSVLLSMVLISVVDIICLFQMVGIYYPAYALMCGNAIVTGIALFMQGNKVINAGRFNWYKIAGAVGVLQSLMFITFNFKIQCIGMVVSAFCNLFMIAILYNEYKGPEKSPERTKAGLLLS